MDAYVSTSLRTRTLTKTYEKRSDPAHARHRLPNDIFHPGHPADLKCMLTRWVCLTLLLLGLLVHADHWESDHYDALA